MALSDHLRANSSAIAERWQSDTLASYSIAASRAFRQEQDPFANPVGHAVRTGTRAAVEALIAGCGANEIAACLDEIIKIRAVQEFTPSQAIGFVFLLKEAVRAVVTVHGDCPDFRGEVRENGTVPLGAQGVQEKGSGPFCRNGPKGASHKRVLTPFPAPFPEPAELAGLEQQIDQVALGVFDIYMRYRDQVCQLRINEVKRSVGRFAGRGPKETIPANQSESEEDLSPQAASQYAQPQRSDGR